jgi:hypothetical protein
MVLSVIETLVNQVQVFVSRSVAGLVFTRFSFLRVKMNLVENKTGHRFHVLTPVHILRVRIR